MKLVFCTSYYYSILTLLPYMPAMPRFTVVIATSFSPFRSEDLMKMQVKRPTRFSAWTTVYGQSGGMARRTANISRSCHILYDRDTFSDIDPSAAFFFPPSRTVFAAIFRLSRSISSWNPNAIISGESTELSTFSKKLKFSGQPFKTSGFAASTFHDTKRTFKGLKEEKEDSRFKSSLS